MKSIWVWSLDLNLNQRIKIELNVKKAFIAFHVYMGSPVVNDCLNIRSLCCPILTRQGGFKQKIQQNQTLQNQIIVCADATGALQSCPMDVLNVCTHMLTTLGPPYQISCSETYSAIRLCSAVCQITKANDYSNILDDIPQESWAFPTDYTTRTPGTKGNFVMQSLTRPAKKTGDVLRGYDKVFSTGGSKIICGGGARVPSNTHTIAKSYSFSGHACVLQVDILRYWRPVVVNYGGLHRELAYRRPCFQTRHTLKFVN